MFHNGYIPIDVNWGSSGQAQVYKMALTNVQQLNKMEDHIKTYTPQVLVMTGLPNMRPSLVDFSYLICKNNSLMICGDILKVQPKLCRFFVAYLCLNITV